MCLCVRVYVCVYVSIKLTLGKISLTVVKPTTATGSYNTINKVNKMCTAQVEAV